MSQDHFGMNITTGFFLHYIYFLWLVFGHFFELGPRGRASLRDSLAVCVHKTLLNSAKFSGLGCMYEHKQLILLS